MVNVYSVRDQYTGYGQLFTSSNDACAIREFRLALSNKDSILNSSAKDFDLMRVGSFDPETGVLIAEDPVIVISGLCVVKEIANV